MDERHGDGERELARRLEAYAEARLRPDPAAMAKVRAAVVAEARRQAGPIPLRRRPAFRLGFALLAAAALVVTIAGSAFASQAGGPLYGARLWLESMNLPTAPAARAEAQLERLDARLQELKTALAAHDEGAAEAALAAYRSILDETLASRSTSSALDQRIEAAISKHLAVLQGLLADAPAQAQDGLRNAIERNDDWLHQLEQRSAGGPGGNPSTPPGQATTPPGQATTPPGQQKSPAATTPPGQATTPPGQQTTPPGQQKPPAQASMVPGQASPSSDPSSQKPSASPKP